MRKPLRHALARYRASGADLPFGNPLAAHGLAMEGYFWRVTDGDRSLIALIGVNAPRDGSPPWATLGQLHKKALVCIMRQHFYGLIAKKEIQWLFSTVENCLT